MNRKEIAAPQHTTKQCFGDGQSQPAHIAPIELFTADVTRKDGLCVYCKSCHASKQRAWKHANVDKVRESKRKYRAKQKLLDAEYRK